MYIEIHVNNMNQYITLSSYCSEVFFFFLVLFFLFLLNHGYNSFSDMLISYLSGLKGVYVSDVLIEAPKRYTETSNRLSKHKCFELYSMTGPKCDLYTAIYPVNLKRAVMLQQLVAIGTYRSVFYSVSYKKGMRE